MKEISPRFLWKTLLLVGLSLLIFAGFSQWNRYQADQGYQALVDLRNNNELGEDMREYLLSSADNQDNTGDQFEFQYQVNPMKEWLDINPDFMGWIRIENTNIDYPYVRSMDNVDYLDRDFYRQRSASGVIFMDYRNLGNFNDNHMVLYGHNMKSKTMFHQLNNYKEKAFFEENSIMELSGLYESKFFQVFSVYEVSANDYSFQLIFQDQEEYLRYLQTIASLSLHPDNLALNAENQLLTLATCSYGVENGRFVVHALEIP